MRDAQLDLAEWLSRIDKPILLDRQHIAREGDPDGHLYGEIVCFTGALSITRKEAAGLAAEAGCTVKNNVIKEMTLLVVGNQDIRRLAGRSKSNKHRRAEKLIRGGQPTRIVTESDFRRLVRIDTQWKS